MAFRSMLAKDAWCYCVKRLSRPGYRGSDLFAINRSTVLIAYIHISYMYIQMYTCISYIYIYTYTLEPATTCFCLQGKEGDALST